MATFSGFSHVPTDLPVDVWVLQYEDYNSTEAAAWRAAGKQQFWYHCIEPSASAALNSFIERPRTQPRQLYWLAAAHGVDGWLYYATDIWRPYPNTSHAPIGRVAPGSAYTDFDPSNYIWSPRTDIFANGDGQFIYPGVRPAAGGGAVPFPVASQRLDLFRDAAEDQALIAAARARDPGAVDALVSRVVRSATDHTDDALLLERTRREIAQLLVTDGMK